MAMQGGAKGTQCQSYLPLISCVTLGVLLTVAGLLSPSGTMQGSNATAPAAERCARESTGWEERPDQTGQEGLTQASLPGSRGASSRPGRGCLHAAALELSRRRCWERARCWPATSPGSAEPSSLRIGVRWGLGEAFPGAVSCGHLCLLWHGERRARLGSD